MVNFKQKEIFWSKSASLQKNCKQIRSLLVAEGTPESSSFTLINQWLHCSLSTKEPRDKSFVTWCECLSALTEVEMTTSCLKNIVPYLYVCCGWSARFIVLYAAAKGRPQLRIWDLLLANRTSDLLMLTYVINSTKYVHQNNTFFVLQTCQSQAITATNFPSVVFAFFITLEMAQCYCEPFLAIFTSCWYFQGTKSYSVVLKFFC